MTTKGQKSLNNTDRYNRKNHMVDQVKVAADERSRLNNRYGEISQTVIFSLLLLVVPSVPGCLWVLAKPSALPDRRSFLFI
jgi:hypothetical protein